MQKLYNLFLFIFTISFLPGQDAWGGVSIATPDNLDAITNNPAGLGISRGSQSGTYIPLGSEFTIHSSNRIDGFGYDLKYEFIDGKFPNAFNPSDGNIGIGFSIFRNAFAGIKWNKHSFLDFGFLYRPFNFASIGLVSQFNDDLTQYNHSILGIALRPLPFLNHKLTLGVDVNFTNENTSDYSPHISLQPSNGVTISARSNSDFNEFQINLGFNFGKESVYSPTTYNDANELNGGIGFYTSSQKQLSILNKKAKDTQKFIRMKLSGLFIEENPITPPFNFDFNISPFSQKPEPGIQLRTWIEEIDNYTNDPDIDGFIIEIGNVRAGFAKRGEIYSALSRFKEAGKAIIVYANKGISNIDYYLVSMADEIYLNEYTGIDLKGLRIEIAFLRGLLDTLLIVPEVFRVEFDGKSYKTAADQFLNKKMSSEMEENYGDLLDDFYSIFVDGISKGRSWDSKHTKEIIDNGPYFKPQDAISSGLADSIMYPDQFDDYVKSLNDEKVEIIKWNDIDRSDDYVHEWAPEKKEKIAIIYAVGGIISGKSNPGPAGSSQMGDETISKAIKSARENDDIKAIVLRIDSGGGSALASDQMWREVLKTTEEDSSNVKPFIASMSDVAASGGYYIACQADTIVAHDATVTGSIGVIGIRLNFSKLMNKWGLSSDIIKKGEFSDFGTGSRLISTEERKKIQGSINDVYSKFKDRVRTGRDNFPDNGNLDDVAMGRVFTGKRAHNGISIPLVDVTGGLETAINLAKTAAGLDGQEIDIVEYPQQEDKFMEMAAKFGTTHYSNLLPEKLAQELEILNVIPILLDNEILMMLPHSFSVK
ncbi:MAG: signal peptide peptidase SppA [Candidatus Marinimicrobia bacterium]|nr:signal peptide peptidase SppA [Candidatus Neomarinimicrobiota bacterium]